MMAGDVVWLVVERQSKEVIGVWADYGDIPNRYVKHFDNAYVVYETALK
jgi:hypothetical protein